MRKNPRSPSNGRFSTRLILLRSSDSGAGVCPAGAGSAVFVCALTISTNTESMLPGDSIVIIIIIIVIIIVIGCRYCDLEICLLLGWGRSLFDGVPARSFREVGHALKPKPLLANPQLDTEIQSLKPTSEMSSRFMSPFS
jgi:hypothetical protein